MADTEYLQQMIAASVTSEEDFNGLSEQVTEAIASDNKFLFLSAFLHLS